LFPAFNNGEYQILGKLLTIGILQEGMGGAFMSKSMYDVARVSNGTNLSSKFTSIYQKMHDYEQGSSTHKKL
jgi:hypothetical protein